jgi:hypothetical protein
MSFETRVVFHPVAAPAAAVYDYARRMENMTRWAGGLVNNVGEADGAWFTETPGGRARIAMAPPNEFGVLDHVVTMPDGAATHNAMRVTPVGDACLLTFVVLRPPAATDAEFERDCGLVAADLKTLAALVETSSRA